MIKHWDFRYQAENRRISCDYHSFAEIIVHGNDSTIVNGKVILVLPPKCQRLANNELRKHFLEHMPKRYSLK